MIHVLEALAAVGGYAVFLFLRPQKNCRWCRGWGVKGRRKSSCRWCSGTGTRFRLGARLVHRGAALIIRRLAQRRRERRDS